MLSRYILHLFKKKKSSLSEDQFKEPHVMWWQEGFQSMHLQPLVSTNWRRGWWSLLKAQCFELDKCTVCWKTAPDSVNARRRVLHPDAPLHRINEEEKLWALTAHCSPPTSGNDENMGGWRGGRIKSSREFRNAGYLLFQKLSVNAPITILMKIVPDVEWNFILQRVTTVLSTEMELALPWNRHGLDGSISWSKTF